MDEYTIIGWPEIQAFMELDCFEDNATLINENDSMGIGSSTYLVNVDWLNVTIGYGGNTSQIQMGLVTSSSMPYPLYFKIWHITLLLLPMTLIMYKNKLRDMKA